MQIFDKLEHFAKLNFRERMKMLRFFYLKNENQVIRFGDFSSKDPVHKILFLHNGTSVKILFVSRKKRKRKT